MKNQAGNAARRDSDKSEQEQAASWLWAVYRSAGFAVATDMPVIDSAPPRRAPRASRRR